MTVYSLVYVSRAADDATVETLMPQIEAILATSRRNNSACGVTGALLVTEGRFVQVLEGERDAVQATYERILHDSRHAEVDILSSQYSDRRRFKEWSMAFVGDSPALRQRFADAPLAALGRRQTGDAVLDFMLDVARSPAETY